MELLIVLFFFSPLTFITGILIAIFSKEKRMLGLIISLVSILIALIGFSVCSRMFNHGPGPDIDKVRPDKPEYFILKYAPTLDSIFCDPEKIVPTNNLMGHIYYGPNGKMLHYTNELRVWDSLRIETGIYKKYEDSIVGYFQEQMIIPYTSIDIHSIEKLDFINSINKKIEPNHHFVLLKNKFCDEFPYYSVSNEPDYKGLVFTYNGDSYDEQEIKKLVEKLNEFLKIEKPNLQ